MSKEHQYSVISIGYLKYKISTVKEYLTFSGVPFLIAKPNHKAGFSDYVIITPERNQDAVIGLCNEYIREVTILIHDASYFSQYDICSTEDAEKQQELMVIEHDLRIED